MNLIKRFLHVLCYYLKANVYHTYKIIFLQFFFLCACFLRFLCTLIAVCISEKPTFRTGHLRKKAKKTEKINTSCNCAHSIHQTYTWLCQMWCSRIYMPPRHADKIVIYVHFCIYYNAFAVYPLDRRAPSCAEAIRDVVALLCSNVTSFILV